MIEASDAKLTDHPTVSCICSRVTPGCSETTFISLVDSSGLQTAKSVTSREGPSVLIPSSLLSLWPDPKPNDVKKSILSTNPRRDCFITMKTLWHEVAISGAPPPPGKRTLGFSYWPITVVFMLPNLSSCAAPRKPTVIRPPCSQ